MKKQVILAVVALITVVSYGQKRELRKAERAIQSQDYTEALAQLKAVEGQIASADNDEKADYYSLKATALTESANGNFSKMKEAAEAISMALEVDPDLGDEIASTRERLRVAIFNSAIEDQNTSNFKGASDKFYTSYNVSKKDTVGLFYAAISAMNAEDYDTALDYNQRLLDMGYTGISNEYVATDSNTGEVVKFDSKTERDIRVKTGEFIKPEIRKTASKRGDVLRSMTVIYVNNGDEEKAMEMIQSARAENPDDISLIKAEADLALQANDMEKFSALMNEIVATDPDNPELYFNLGVGADDMGNADKAEEYYKKSIELKPDYVPSLINLGALRLKEEASIVDEMNSLGTSREDNARYDELKQLRENIYKEVLTYFEKAATLEKENLGLAKTLMNIYSQLGMDVKFKEMKARVAELESGN